MTVLRLSLHYAERGVDGLSKPRCDARYTVTRRCQEMSNGRKKLACDTGTAVSHGTGMGEEVRRGGEKWRKRWEGKWQIQILTAIQSEEEE